MPIPDTSLGRETQEKSRHIPHTHSSPAHKKVGTVEWHQTSIGLRTPITNHSNKYIPYSYSQARTILLCNYKRCKSTHHVQNNPPPNRTQTDQEYAYPTSPTHSSRSTSPSHIRSPPRPYMARASSLHNVASLLFVTVTLKKRLECWQSVWSDLINIQSSW